MLCKKSAVQVIGRQSNGMWIFSKDICISPSAELLTEGDSSFA